MAYHFFRSWLSRTRCAFPCTVPSRSYTRLYVEVLECRCLPSTVTNLSDHDPGSLRDALASTPVGGTVDFQPGLSGSITLTSDTLTITRDVIIASPGAGLITLS